MRALGAALLACALGLLAGLWAWRAPLPDLDVRSAPRFPHAGRMLEGEPLVQEFHCRAAGLRRLELAVAHLSNEPHGQLVLELHPREAPLDAVPLRRVSVPITDLPEATGFLPFEFEPLADSAGRWYRAHFSVRSGDVHASLTPTLRLLRRAADGVSATGAGPVPLRRAFRPRHAELSAIALHLRAVERGASPLRIEILDAGSEAVLARGSWSAPHPVRGGWHVFELEQALSRSRYRHLILQLVPSEGASIHGQAEGPAFVALCGAPERLARLGSLWVHGEQRADQSLVLRTWADDSLPARLRLAHRRWGARGPLLLALLLAAAWAGYGVVRKPSQRTAKRA